ncbi:MAG: hypothetical protein RMK60_06585 [Burkholderiales bacterium]|nr:hypothetical protein [Burkholderiales bacterium]
MRRLVNALAEPYAYAVLTWPAVVGVFLLQGQAGQGPWHYLLYGWLGLVHLAAYTGGRGFGFGNLITFNSLCMTLACMTHPSPWTLAWLPVLLIGLLAAQRVRWRQVGTRHARRA